MRLLLLIASMMLVGCPKQAPQGPLPGEHMPRVHAEPGPTAGDCTSVVTFEWTGHPDYDTLYVLIKLEGQYFGVGARLEEPDVTYAACVDYPLKWLGVIQFYTNPLPPGVNMNPDPQWDTIPWSYYGWEPATFKLPSTTVWKRERGASGHTSAMVKTEVPVGLVIRFYPGAEQLSTRPGILYMEF